MNYKNIFPKLPVTLQNNIFSLYGLNSKHKRYSGNFKKYLIELQETEWYSHPKIEEYQNDKFIKIVNELRNVPYYREIFAQNGISFSQIRDITDLNKIPILTKKDAKSNSEFLLNSKYKKRDLYFNLTSGTTGTPQKIYFTKDEMKFQWATFWRHRSRFNFYPGDKFLMFGARLPILTNKAEATYWRVNKALNQHYVSSYDIKKSNFMQLVNYINKEKFRFFVGYPSAVYNFVSLMKKHNVKLDYKPEYFFSASDLLLPYFEKTIKEHLNVQVTDFYGSAEFCGNFSRCEQDKFHLDFESGIVELLPIKNHENSLYKKIIFTGISNTAMPFVRYEIGDYAIISKEKKCSCGRESEIIERVEGRTEDYIRTPDGRTAIGMNQAFEWTPNIKEAQIIQNHIEKINVNIVPDKNYSHKDEKILLNELRKRVGNIIDIKFYYLDEIKPSKNGKKRLVISSLASQNEGEKRLKNQVKENII